jgi:hypothetical protein
MKLTMKKIFLLSAILLTFNVLISFSQKYSNNQFVVFSYALDVDSKVKTELQPLENYIQVRTEKKQTKVDAMLVHSVYKIVTNLLADSLKIFFLPPNSFGNAIKYDDYGYPNIVIQKAIRLSDSKYYIKIDVSIENSKYDEKGKKLQEGLFYPVVNVSLDIYNKFGFNPIQTAEGQAVAVAPINVTSDFIAGLEFVNLDKTVSSTNENLMSLINRAMNEAVYSIIYRKQK